MVSSRGLGDVYKRQIDWIKLMANDLARRIQIENEAYRECLERFVPIEYRDKASEFLSIYESRKLITPPSNQHNNE